MAKNGNIRNKCEAKKQSSATRDERDIATMLIKILDTFLHSVLQIFHYVLEHRFAVKYRNEKDELGLLTLLLKGIRNRIIELLNQVLTDG